MKAELAEAAPFHELAALSEKFGSDKTRFCPIYESYFHTSRDRPLNFLEIGVGGYDDPKAGGASVRMWAEYFPNAKIFALDYHDKSPHQTDRITIFRGSQADEAFLRRVADEIGRIDVILDDGSHVSQHVITSFNILYPLLASGGLYIVEDIGTSYWPDFGGSEDIHAKSTSMAAFKRLADGVNHPHVKKGLVPTQNDLMTRHVNFYENFVVVRKL